MYHIPNDKRAIESANAIALGLVNSLKNSAFVDISVSKLISNSNSSRTTFYRLFDNVYDVLYWKCEQILIDAINKANESNAISFKQIFSHFYATWLKNEQLLKSLINNSLEEVLFDIHSKHKDAIANLLLKDKQLDEMEKEYFSTLLSAIIPATFKIWINSPNKDPDKIYAQIRNGIYLLSNVFYID